MYRLDLTLPFPSSRRRMSNQRPFVFLVLLFSGHWSLCQSDIRIVDSIQVLGNKHTERMVILREFDLEPGDTLSQQELNDIMAQSKARLESTFLFTRCQILQIPDSVLLNHCRIQVIVIENWKEVHKLHSKAFEIYKNDGRLNELLKYPNEQDTWGDFIEAWAGFKLVTGNSFVYAKMIEGGNNNGKPYELYVLPAQYMYILADIQRFPPTIAGYQLNYGPLWDFSKQEILQDKYFNPQWNTTGNQLYGQSPLMAAAKNLTRSNEAKTAAVASFQNGGPAGVLFMNDDRFDPMSGSQQAQALKKECFDMADSYTCVLGYMKQEKIW